LVADGVNVLAEVREKGARLAEKGGCDMSWANALHALPAQADAAGMRVSDRKLPRRLDREVPRDRILGAWAEVQDALYKAAGTPSVSEAGHRLRYHGMSLRITDVILSMRHLREQLATAGELNERDAEVYEQLAMRAVLSIRKTIR
jgi:hypothetical protein